MTAKPVEPRKIFEPEKPPEFLRGLLRHAHKARDRHDIAARQLDTRRLWLGGAAAVSAAIVGTSVFTALGEDASNGFKVIIAMISILSAILGGVSAFLNLSERSEKHRTAGVRYKSIIWELERRISEEHDNPDLAYSALEELSNRFSNLEDSTPIVPEKIYDRVENDWKTRGVEPVTKADDLYKPATKK